MAPKVLFTVSGALERKEGWTDRIFIVPHPLHSSLPIFIHLPCPLLESYTLINEDVAVEVAFQSFLDRIFRERVRMVVERALRITTGAAVSPVAAWMCTAVLFVIASYIGAFPGPNPDFKT